MPETIHVRGEGGAVLAMDLPLPEGIADRYAAGLLPRVHSDGTPWYAPPVPSAGSALTQGTVPRPATVATKPAWVAWALAVHGLDQAEAEGMTKAALADLPDEPALAPAAPVGGDSDLTAGRTAAPSEDAPKSEWIRLVVSRGLLSAEDAANYTKADLIDMVK